MTTDVSYGGLRARVSGIADHLTEHQGPLQQVIQGLEGEAGEGGAALDEVLQALTQAKQQCEEAAQLLNVAESGAQTAAAGLTG